MVAGYPANLQLTHTATYRDAQSKFLGPYIAPHTNLTEIDIALDLFWRAGVDPSKVVMGQGWYVHFEASPCTVIASELPKILETRGPLFSHDHSHGFESSYGQQC